jgi:hypothetical protein
MEVAVVADEVLGADGRIGIHRVRAEVLDGEGHVRAVRIDYSAAKSAERVRFVAHSETVPARSDSAASPSDVEDDRHRPVVHELDLHPRSEHSGLDRHAEFA